MEITVVTRGKTVYMRNKIMALKHREPDFSLTGSHVIRSFPYKVLFYQTYLFKNAYEHFQAIRPFWL